MLYIITAYSNELVYVRMTSLENTADLMESADDHLALITQKLDTIMSESMDISSFNLPDLSLQSDIKVRLCLVQTINTLILRVEHSNVIINP